MANKQAVETHEEDRIDKHPRPPIPGSFHEAAGFKKRVQLDFSPSAYRRLMHLQGISAAPTVAKVIRQSLLLMDWYMTLRRQGFTLQMKGPDGAVVEMVEPEHVFD